MSNVAQLVPAIPDVTVSLATSTVLVKLTITAWTASVKDRKASSKTADDNQVKNKRAVRTYKSLLPDAQVRNDIDLIVGEARRSLAAMTLPWSDGGDRILDIRQLGQFRQMMDNFKQRFEDGVEKLCDEYDKEITKAAFTMGAMFDRKDYPTVTEIRRKYSFHYSVSPLPTTADFRVDVPRDVAEELKGMYLRDGNARVDAAMRDAWSRLHEKIQHLIDRLSDNDEGERKIFRGGLLESAYELIDVLQYLNVGKDMALEQARLALRDALQGYNTEQLRNSTVKRLEVAASVQDVMARFSMLQMD